MSYPVLPMAIVTFLAGASEERSGLRKGTKHVTVLAHHDKNVRAVRFEIDNDGNWATMIERSVMLFNEGDTDTMTVIYPADDDTVDFGIILEANKAPSCFTWGYNPKFDIRLAPENVEQSISKGVGVEMLQELLDKAARGQKTVPSPIAAFPTVRFGGQPLKPTN